MAIAKDIGLTVTEKKIKPAELKKADEIFLVGTAAEIWPVVRVDNAKIKTGPVTEKIKLEYMKTVRGENKKYLKWLTYV